MNKKFIDEYNELTALWNKFEELEVEIDTREDQLYHTLTDIFIADKLLEGTWNVKLSDYKLIFTPVKLKNKQVLKKYRKDVQKHIYRSRFRFFISNNASLPATIYFFDNFKIEISWLNFNVNSLNKFLQEYGITLNKLEVVELGIDLGNVFAVREKILELTNKK